MGRLAWRLLLAALSLALAVLAGLHAATAALGRAEPDLALQFDPGDPVALISQADRRLAEAGGTHLSAAQLTAMGQRALRSAPLSAGALRLLGLAADTLNDEGRARALMSTSMRVSRRDFFAHVWMIEDRVAAGDIRGALDQYDLALSTNDRAPDFLFPVLSTALENPQIRANFVSLIGQSRPWMPGFLGYAINSNQRPQDLADLIIRSGGMPRDPGYATLDTQLLTQLVAKGQYGSAYRYGLTIPGARAQTFSAAGFSDETLNPSFGPLTWRLADQPDIRARREGATSIVVSAASGARGVVATRTIYLKPGIYRFVQAIAPLPQVDPASLTWDLRCLPDRPSGPLFQQDVPTSDAGKRYSAPVTVPAQCPVQQLSIIVTGKDSRSDSGVGVGPIAFEAASAAR